MPSYHLLHLLLPILISTTLSTAQGLANLPQCLQTCINNNAANCAPADVACICRLSSTSFLGSVVNCYTTTCPQTIAINLVLSALQPICALAAAPIPSAAIASAESVASNAVAEASTAANAAVSSADAAASSAVVVAGGGFTTSDGGVVGVFPTTTGSGPAGLVTTTILGFETNSVGATETIAVPEVYGPSTTVLGVPVILTGSAISGRPTAIPLGGTGSGSTGQSGAVTTTVGGQSTLSGETSMVEVTESTSATGSTSGAVSSNAPSGTTTGAATSTGPNGSLLTSQSKARRHMPNSGLLVLGILSVGSILYQ